MIDLCCPNYKRDLVIIYIKGGFIVTLTSYPGLLQGTGYQFCQESMYTGRKFKPGAFKLCMVTTNNNNLSLNNNILLAIVGYSRLNDIF